MAGYGLLEKNIETNRRPQYKFNFCGTCGTTVGFHEVICRECKEDEELENSPIEEVGNA